MLHMIKPYEKVIYFFVHERILCSYYASLIICNNIKISSQDTYPMWWEPCRRSAPLIQQMLWVTTPSEEVWIHPHGLVSSQFLPWCLPVRHNVIKKDRIIRRIIFTFSSAKDFSFNRLLYHFLLLVISCNITP